MSSARTSIGLIAWTSVLGGCFMGSCIAEEPAKRFLERLRQEEMYEMGLKYLELAEKRNRLPPSMKNDVPLEKILFLQESLKSLQRPEQVEERMGQIESGLKNFIDTAPQHPRRSEAQTKLGDLLLNRAQIALADAKKDVNAAKVPELRSKARKWFLDAIQLYAKITEDLKPLIEALAGNKAQSPEQVELRDKYRTEYRQAEILQAKTMEFVSTTYEPNSPEWKQWLEKSEAKLSEIIDKTSGSKEAGRRFLSLLYRGEVQSQLEKVDAARESFGRVADNDEGGVFRVWKVQALTGLIRLDSTPKSPKYELAIKLGEDTLKYATNQERDDPHWVDLQLALAQARLAWGKTIDEKKEEGKFRNNRREARELLQALLKRRGPHQEVVKKLLSEIGIESSKREDEKLPEPKTFEEAVTQARLRLDRAENTDATISILEQQGGSKEDIDAVREDSRKDRLQAIAIFGKAIRMYRDSDGRDDLLEAKFLMCYLYLRTDQFWHSTAIAQAIMRSDRGTEKAQRSGGFALLSLQKIIAAASAEDQAALIPTLEKLAKTLRDSSPDSEESQNAIDMLVQLSLINKKYDQAERYIAMNGNKGGASASILGQFLWRDYMLKSIENRNEKREESAEDKELKARAEKLLRSGWDSLDPAKADKNVAMGANTLANVYLQTDRLTEAMQVIDEPKKGALALANNVADLEANVKLEAFKLKLQAMVQSAGTGGTPLEAPQVVAVVDQMKALSAGDPTLLTNALRNLAVAISSKIDLAKTPDEQAKLGAASGILVQQLVGITSDLGILDSAGYSVFTLGSNLQKVPGLAAQAKSLMAIADEAYSKIASKPEAEIVAANRKPEEFQMKLALAKAGAGKFEDAHKIFVASLTKSPSNVTLQVEAAKNLQRWSENKNTELLNKAWAGSDPNEKKQNVVWGWGKIAKITSSRINDFRDIFFDARYNLAWCRKTIGMLQTDPAAKKKFLQQAAKDIKEVGAIYPEYGTPEFKAQFEKLDKEIQLELSR